MKRLVRCSNCGYWSDAEYTGAAPAGWNPCCEYCGPQPHDRSLDLLEPAAIPATAIVKRRLESLVAEGAGCV